MGIRRTQFRFGRRNIFILRSSKTIAGKISSRKPVDDEIDWAKKRRDYLQSIPSGPKWKNRKEQERPIIPAPNSIPQLDDKWSHQVDAMNWFLDKEHANGVGIFQMATGSGKTRTSISTVKEAISRGIVKKAIFCVPKTLEDQWAKELSEHYSDRGVPFGGVQGEMNIFHFLISISRAR